MGFNIFNIEDVSGNNTGGGPDGWIYTIDLWTFVDQVSGDFDDVDLLSGASNGEAADGYTYSALSTTAYGTLTSNSATGQWTFFMDRAAVLAGGTDQTVTFTITGTDGGSSDDDSVTVNILICLCAGTMVDTPDGPRTVESLSTGDLISTADNGPVELQWIGSRKVTPSEFTLSPDLRPVRISQGALGKDMPIRDLSVSPNHHVMIRDWRALMMFGEEEVLVPAKALVNGDTIATDTGVSQTEYFHLLFDTHQIIWTDGAPTESFFPGPYSLKMLAPEKRFELLELFPNLSEENGYGEAARLCLTPREGQVLKTVASDTKTSRFQSVA